MQRPGKLGAYCRGGGADRLPAEALLWPDLNTLTGHVVLQLAQQQQRQASGSPIEPLELCELQ